MAQPTPYSRDTLFTAFSSANPNRPHSGAALDAEFSAIAQTLDGTLNNLAKIQRDDGKLANGVVTKDALAPGLIAEMLQPAGPGAPVGSAAAALGVFRVDDYCLVNTQAGNTAGFQALAAAVNLADGGIIEFTTGKTYLCGQQTFSGGAPPAGEYSFHTGIPAKLFEFLDCTRPIIVRMNGAKIKVVAGKYGSYNADGTVRPDANPFVGYYGPTIATYYEYIFHFTNCTGHIHIEYGELDGSMEQAQLGGQWGDTGWQLAGVGVKLSECSGGFSMVGVDSHSHTLDGFLINGVSFTEAAYSDRGVVTACKFNRNGRLGVAFVGGRGWKFQSCEFNFNANVSLDGGGTSPIQTAPASGIDMEAEAGKINRDISFELCDFIGNRNTQAVLDSGPTRRVSFKECKFVCTLAGSASLWPNKPEISCHKCTFAGTVIQPYQDVQNPSERPRFTECRFTSDPSFSPTGTLGLTNGLLLDIPNASGVQFNLCVFDHYQAGAGGAFSSDPNAPDLTDCTVIVRGPFFIAGIAGTTMTVTKVVPGHDPIVVGTLLRGDGVTPGTSVTALGTGTGGLGTYTVSVSQNVQAGITIYNLGTAGVPSTGAQPTLVGRFKGRTEFVEFGTGNIQVLPFNNFSATDPNRFKATAGAKSTNGFTYRKADGVIYDYPASFDATANKSLYWGEATFDPPSLAAGAKSAIQTMTVTGVAVGDRIDNVSFSGDLAGAEVKAWVSAANTVSFYFVNDNGANPLDLASGTVRVKVTGS